jgi:hypothetical protein
MNRSIISLVFVFLALLAVAGMVQTVEASSHREAPAISESPKCDATDFYMFRSYETGRENFVTLLACYQPLQDPYGGPNFFTMDPNALYEIHIDNNGDSVEDLTFQFRFTNVYRRISVSAGGVVNTIPLAAAGEVTTVEDADLNVIERYTVTLVTGDRRSGTASAVTNSANGTTIFTKPADNAGDKTFPSYATYASAHIVGINVPGFSTAGRMFVGQRKDPFFVNLGDIFDLVDIPSPVGEAFANLNQNDLDDKNVTVIGLELPISSVLGTGTDPVIGAWTSASLPQGRLLNPLPNRSNDNGSSVEGGAFVQVSRLGMPLVNEVVIGIDAKDRFNASEPREDAQFLSFVTNPTLPVLLNLLFPTLPAPALTPRNDLVDVFLLGLDGLNSPENVVASEMLRLNTSTAVTSFALQNTLGVIAGDNAGFPNGRRPNDDVVDIELRVAYGLLAPGGPSVEFVDGTRDRTGTSSFPYLATPIPGSD